MTAAPQYFTAARLARALGRQRQALARSLAGIRADGQTVVAGNPAPAWSLAALPAPLQKELEAAAQRQGYRNALALLAVPVKLWQPAIPLSEVSPANLNDAAKLQRSLARALARQDDPALTSAALEQMAVEDYAREFGHAISTRAIREHIKRTLARDNGALNFSRLEIYLPERPARAVATKPIISLAAESDFQPLHEIIAQFKNPAAPNATEKSYLWLCAFEIYETKLAEGKAPQKAKRNLIKFLERNAPFLVASGCAAQALRVNFSRKFVRWIGSGRNATSLADARAENSGRWRAPELSTEDKDKLTAHAVLHCGGRVSQAYRELAGRNELSEEITGYYLSNPASKSYVPKTLRDAIKHDVAMLEDIHHGPRQAKLNGPHISRDWTPVHSGDWYQADDFTFPIYYIVPDGQGWFNLQRGQVLLMVCVRSMRILGFVLLSSPNYCANDIRTLTTRVCDDHGLPRKGFYYENGIWKKSKVLKGSANDNGISWDQTDMGLREFGLCFVHARLPRAKVVERIGGLLQDLMEGLPGYVGRNEQIEKFERIQKKMREIRSEKLNPVGVLMNADQWADTLEKLCEQYNASIQNGKLLDGLSPDEAFRQFNDAADPAIKFPPALRALFSHNKRPARVTGKGILVNKEYYYSEDINRLIGQTVLAWFNTETPELITITDMQRQSAVCVPAAPQVPGMGATSEQMAAAHRQIAGFQAYAFDRYRTLKSKYSVPFRAMVVDRETAGLCKQIEGQRTALISAQGEQQRQETKARKLSNRLNMAAPSTRKLRPETLPALQRLNELLEDDATETKGTL